MKSKFFTILKNPKAYCRLVGGLLFVLGLVGFAFRSRNSLPDIYLAGALILGFWGLVVSFAPDRN